MEGPERTTAAADVRVVVDAQIALAMFLVRRDRPHASPTQRLLLRLLARPTFRWLWTPDIIADYERGAVAIDQDSRIMRRAAFDRQGFRLLLAALQVHPPVSVSVTTLREARQQIAQAAHPRQQDLDDAIYLACAVDGGAEVLTSYDATLLAVGERYAGVRIVPWPAFVADMQARGLLAPGPEEPPESA
jgi:predicted nucleic acid-binding protein